MYIGNQSRKKRKIAQSGHTDMHQFGETRVENGDNLGELQLLVTATIVP
jgi:hypothetical protein